MASGRTNVGRPTPLRVLVVEDQPECAHALAFVLRMYGHQPEVAADGPAALAAAAARPPDVVLTDLNLPGMDGFELAGRLLHLLRERPLLVATTGHADDTTRRRCLEAGFDDYLVKPFGPAELHPLLQVRAGSPRQRTAGGFALGDALTPAVPAGRSPW